MKKTILAIDPDRMLEYMSQQEFERKLDSNRRISGEVTPSEGVDHLIDPIWSLDAERDECELTFTLAAEKGTEMELIELNSVCSTEINQGLIEMIDDHGLDDVLGGEAVGVMPIGVTVAMDGTVTVQFSIYDDDDPPYIFVLTSAPYGDYTLVASVWRDEVLAEQYFIRIFRDGRVSIGREE